jgi:hypothetical protein
MLVAVVGCAGCRLDVTTAVDVRDDGSGTVEVAVGLDEDAVRRVPNLRNQLRTDDLVDAGWTITGPVEEDGTTWVRARKPFATPAEAGRVLNELVGEQGPFKDFAVTRDRSFARTSYGFKGTVDFVEGVEAFSDEELEQVLDGEALGDSVEEFTRRVGESLDRIFRFRVAVRLPGEVTSNAPGRAANGAVWQPKLSDREASELRAQSRTWEVAPLAWTAIAVAAAIGFALVVAIRLTARRRSGPNRSA